MTAPLVTAKAINPSLPSIPFWRLVVVELRKLFGTWGPRILLGFIALAWLIVLAVVSLIRNAPTFAETVTAFGVVTRIFIAIIAILLVTTEWGQRSVLNLFTLEPRRDRVIAAKLSASLIAAAGLFAGYLALAAMVTAARGGSFGGAAEEIRFAGIRALFDLLMAFAFALLILNTAGAIVTYVILPDFLVPTILTIGSAASGGLEAGGGSDAFSQLGEWISPQHAFAALSGSSPGASTWAHILVCSVVWIGIPAVLGVYRVMTSEVK